jgi:hypothetical protein
MSAITEEAIRRAEEMAEDIENLSPDRLCWLVFQNTALKNLPDYSAEAILIIELMRRIWDKLPEAQPTHFGWIIGNEVIDCREPLENDN